MTKQYGVFEYRADAHYHLADVMGSRVFKREHAAEAYAAKLAEELLKDNTFVVRSLDYVHTNDTVISEKGIVRITQPCGCIPRSLPGCVYHGKHGLPVEVQERVHAQFV